MSDITKGEKPNNRDIYNNREVDQTAEAEQSTEKNINDDGLGTPVRDGIGLKSYTQTALQYDDWVRKNGGLVDDFGGLTGNVEGFGESSYDKNIVGKENLQHLNQFRYQEQGTVPAVFNSIVRAGVEALNTGVVGVLAKLNGIYQGIENLKDDNPDTGFWNGFWNNNTTRFQNDIREFMKKYVPSYQSESSRDLNPLEYMASRDFWTGYIESTGFTAGMLLEGYLTGGFSLVGKAANLLKFLNVGERGVNIAYKMLAGAFGATSEASMEALNTYDDMKSRLQGEAYAKYQQDLAMANLEMQNEIASEIIKQNPSLRGENPVHIPEQEAAIAQSIKDKYGDRLKQIEDNYNNMYQDIENRALSSGSMDFGLNMIILSISNALGVLSFLKKPFQNEERQVAKGFFQGLREKFKPITDKPYGEGISKWEARAIAGREMLAEGFEETNQKWASELAQQYYRQQFDPNSTEEFKSFASTAFDTFKTVYSDPETWKEFISGALTGLTGTFNPQGVIKKLSGQKTELADYWQGGAIEAWREGNKLSDRSKDAYDLMNKVATDNNLKNNVRAAIFNIASKQRQMEAAASGDKFAFENEIDAQTINTIQTFANAGRLNDLKALVGVDENMSDEELDAICDGLTVKGEDGRYTSDYSFLVTENGERISNILDKNDPARQNARKKLVDQSKKIMDTIDTYKKAIDDADRVTGYKLDPEKLNFIAWQITQVKNWNNREKEMYDKDSFKEYIGRLRESIVNYVNLGNQAKERMESLQGDLNKAAKDYGKVSGDANIYDTLLKQLQEELKQAESLYAVSEDGTQRKRKLNKKEKERIDNKVKAIKNRIKNTKLRKSYLERSKAKYEQLAKEQQANSVFVENGKAAENMLGEFDEFNKEYSGSFNDIFELMNKFDSDRKNFGIDELGGLITVGQLFKPEGYKEMEDLLVDMQKCINASNALQKYVNQLLEDPSKISEAQSEAYNVHNRQVVSSIDDEIEKSLQDIEVLGDVNDPWQDDDIFLRVGDEKLNDKIDSYNKLLENAKKRLRMSLIFDNSNMTDKEINEKINDIVNKKINKLRKENKSLDKFLEAYELSKQFSDLLEEVIDETNIEQFNDKTVKKAIMKAQQLFEAVNVFAFSKGVHPILISREEILGIYDELGNGIEDMSDRLAISFVTRIYNNIKDKLNNLNVEGKIVETTSSEEDETKDGVSPSTANMYSAESNIFQRYNERLLSENPEWKDGNPRPPQPPQKPKRELSKLPDVELTEAKDNSGKELRGQRQILYNIRKIQENADIPFGDELKIGDNTLKEYSSAISRIEGNVANGAVLTDEQANFLAVAKKRLEEAGYEVSNEISVGKPFNDGMKVTANFINDETLPVGSMIISKVETPQLLLNGKMVQSATITVRQNLKDDDGDGDGDKFMGFPIGVLSVHSQEYVNTTHNGRYEVNEDSNARNPRADWIMHNNNAFDFVNSGKLAELKAKAKDGKVQIYGRLESDNVGVIPGTLFLYVDTGNNNYQMIGYIQSETEKESPFSCSLLGIDIDKPFKNGRYRDNKKGVQEVNIESQTIPSRQDFIALRNTNGEPLSLVLVANGKVFYNDSQQNIGSVPYGTKPFNDAMENGDLFIIAGNTFIGNKTDEFDPKYSSGKIAIVVRRPDDNKLHITELLNTVQLNDALSRTREDGSETSVVRIFKEHLAAKVKQFVNEYYKILKSDSKDKKTQIGVEAFSDIFSGFITSNIYHDGLTTNEFSYTLPSRDLGSAGKMPAKMVSMKNSCETQVNMTQDNAIITLNIYAAPQSQNKDRSLLFSIKMDMTQNDFISASNEDIASKLTNQIFDSLKKISNVQLKLNTQLKEKGSTKRYSDEYEAQDLGNVLQSFARNHQYQNTKILLTYTDNPSDVNIDMSTYTNIDGRLGERVDKYRFMKISIKGADGKTNDFYIRDMATSTDGDKELFVGRNSALVDKNSYNYKADSETFDDFKALLDPDNVMSDEVFRAFMLNIYKDYYETKEKDELLYYNYLDYEFETIVNGEPRTYVFDNGKITEKGKQNKKDEKQPVTTNTTPQKQEKKQEVPERKNEGKTTVTIESTDTDSKNGTGTTFTDEDGETYNTGNIQDIDAGADDDEIYSRKVNDSAQDVNLREGNNNGFLFLQDTLKQIAPLLDTRDRELIDFILNNISKRLIVRVLNKNDWKKLQEAKNLKKSTLGVYNRQSNTIYFNEATDVTTIIHEMAHAATISYLRKIFNDEVSEDLLEEFTNIYETVRDLYKTNKEMFNGIDGLVNVFEQPNIQRSIVEFVGEVMANKKLQTLLKSIRTKKDERDAELDKQQKPSGLRRLGNAIKNIFTKNGVKETVAEDMVEYTLFDKFKAAIIKLPKVKEEKRPLRTSMSQYSVRTTSYSNSNNVIYDTNLTNAPQSEVKTVSTDGMLKKYDSDGMWSNEYRKINDEFTEKTGQVFDMNDTSNYGLRVRNAFFEYVKSKGFSGIDSASFNEMTYSKYSKDSYIVNFENNNEEQGNSSGISDEKLSEVNAKTEEEILSCN